MQRFEFSLERLLQVKRQLERQAEQVQRRARFAVEEAQAQVVCLRQQLQRLGEQLAGQVGCLLDGQQWATTVQLSDIYAQALQGAEKRLAEAEEHYQRAARLRLQLTQEVEALQTLRHQHWEQWRQQRQKVDQERLDELGLRRWQAEQAEAAAT
ncbi:MAG: flagellar FliJ family protein [Gemmataceae bacterium]|nr:flagellar FliJ family protein [Gemmataceae bacterium]